ncbi:MAG: hypothetical protein RL338_577 [Chloroflexota bacterium]
MKKILALVALGAIAFGVVSAAAAGLGSNSATSATLGAASTTVSGCGSITTPSVTYTTAFASTKYDVTHIVISGTSGDDWSAGTSCVGKTAKVSFGSTEVFSASISSGDIAGNVLTLNVTDTDAATVSNVAIIIQ